MGAVALSPIIDDKSAESEDYVSSQQKRHKPKTPPLAIPLPFEKTVEGLLKTRPHAKKRPVTKKASGKRKKRSGS
jgi:hypothetical protein